MRLLNLAVEGFMPYRDRQTLNFQDKTIFALVGPTGSGKSALLDAITFALFGKAPRWGKESPAKSLLSQGKKKLTVEVQFQVKGQVYQVLRSFSSSKQEAQLRQQVESGEFRPMGAERLTPAQLTPEIENLIGMDYSTFTKTLMLPQGQFDRLLKPQKPIERKELLIQLAGLGLYDELNTRLSSRIKPLELDLYAQESRAERFKALDPENLKLFEAQLQQRRDFQKEVTEQRTQAEARVRQVEKDLEAWEKLRKGELALSQLRARQPEIEEKKLRLERSARVASQRHLLRDLDQRRQGLEEARNRLEKAQKDCLNLDNRLEPVRRTLEDAQEAANQIPELRQQRERLLTLKASLLPYQEKLNDRESRLRLHQTKLKHQEEVCSQLKTTQQKYEDLQIQLQSLQKDLSESSQSQVATWEKALEFCQELLKISDQLDERSRGLHQSNLQKEQQQKRLAEDERRLEEARQHQQELLNQERLLQQELSSQFLRGQLQVDCVCPVCLQTVTELPEAAEVEQSQLEALKTRLEAQHQVVERLDREVRKQEQSMAALDSSLANLEQQRSLLAEEFAQKQQSFRDECGEGLDLPTIQQRLQAAREEDQKNQLLQQKFQQFEIQLRELSTRSQLQAKDRDTVQQQIEELSRELQQLDGQIEELEASLRSELGDPSVSQSELEGRAQQLQQTITRLESELKRAAEAHQELLSLHQAAEKAQEIYHQQHQKESSQLQQLEQELADFLSQSGLASEQQMREWVLPAEQQADWEKAVHEHEKNLSAQEDSQKLLADELQGRQPSLQQRDEARQRAQQLQADLNGCNQEIGRLEQQIQEFLANQAQFEELTAELQQTRHRLDVHKKLAGMLNATGLKAFVANRLLEEILVLASSEMERLSGRYQLTMKGEELEVVDIWNAGEGRDVRSLSGGETFLASLSLALAMIEYLSQGSPLESLFIDEGFGTLDSETLEAVTQTLEGLQAKGRLVGVITHVPELAERLPVQVRIEKGQGASRILE